MDLTLLSGILGGAGVAFGIFRGQRQEHRESNTERRESDSELNTRIDERIKLGVGEQLVRITTILEEVQLRMPAAGDLARDNERIEQLEVKQKDQQRAIDQLFDLVRRTERNCARNGHLTGSDTDSMPRQGERS